MIKEKVSLALIWIKFQRGHKLSLIPHWETSKDNRDKIHQGGIQGKHSYICDGNERAYMIL